MNKVRLLTACTLTLLILVGCSPQNRSPSARSLLGSSITRSDAAPTTLAAMGNLPSHPEGADEEETFPLMMSREEARIASQNKVTTGTLEPEIPSVIITLKGDPLFVREKKTKLTKAERAAARTQIRDQHRRVLSSLAKRSGKKIRETRTGAENPTQGEILAISYDRALNGLNLRGISLKDAKAQLSGMAEVANITVDSKVYGSLSESVPQIKAPGVWAQPDTKGLALDGTGVVIGIIDTGVDYTHPDLGGCLGIGCKVIGGWDFVNNDANPKDDQGHGTHVAATAAGLGVLKGVAPGASLVAYKVLNAAGSGSMSTVILAIEACGDPNGDGNTADHLPVCSMSLGSSESDPNSPDALAVDRVTAMGVVFSIAAGNSGPTAKTIGSPGVARSAVTVAASCKASQLSSGLCSSPIANFSSRGPVEYSEGGVLKTLAKPDVAAPGVNICAARWGTAWPGRECAGDAAHVAISGTSMATPHVAGVLALLRQAHPELTPAQLKNVLMSTARNLGAAVTPEQQGAGEVDVSAALTAVGPPSANFFISGLPLTYQIEPTSAVVTQSKTIRVTQTAAGTVSYSLQPSTTPSGITTQIQPAQFSLAQNQYKDVVITFNYNFQVLVTPYQARIDILMNTSAGNSKFAATSNISPALVPSVSAIALGINNADLSVWDKTVPITIQNINRDIPATLQGSVDCCASNAGISTSLNPQSITVPAGGSATVNFGISVQNTLVPNAAYSGSLTLTGSKQTLSLPISFQKGYEIRMNFGTLVPSFVILQGQLNRKVFYPSTTTLTVFSTESGPWKTLSFHNLSPKVVLENDILTSVGGIAQLNEDVADGVNKVNFRPIRPDGTLATFITGSFTLDTGAYGIGIGAVGGLSLQDRIRFNKLNPDNRMSIVGTSPAGVGKADLVLMEYVGGATSTVNVESTASEAKILPLKIFEHNPRLIGNYSILAQGCDYSFDEGGSCSFTNNSYVTPDSTGLMRFTLMEKQSAYYPNRPDALGVHGILMEVISNGVKVYGLPIIASMKNGLVAFDFVGADYGTGLTHPDLGLVSGAERFRCGGLTGARYLSVGSAPTYMQGLSSGTTFGGRLQSRSGLFRPVDCVTQRYPATDAVADPSSFVKKELYRGGALLSSETFGDFYTGNFPQWISTDLVDPATGTLPSGDYELRLLKPVYLNKQLVNVGSRHFFKSVSGKASPFPSLRGARVESNTLNQSVIDPALSNSLIFEVDPRPLAEGFASVKLLKLDASGNNPVEIPLTSLGGGKYSAPVTAASGTTLAFFRIVATDSALNRSEFDLKIPVGTALNLTSVGLGTAPAPSPSPTPTTRCRAKGNKGC